MSPCHCNCATNDDRAVNGVDTSSTTEAAAMSGAQQGETVLELGSRDGANVFVAAARVGPTGQAIGLDSSDDMIARARGIAASKGLAPPHVAFVKTAWTEHLPIESDAVDRVLSNRVLHLLPLAERTEVMRDIYRILKPGGRVTFDDDIVGEGKVRVTLLQEYRALLENAGFKDVSLAETPCDLDGERYGIAGSDVANLLATSYRVYAIKPGTASTTKPAPGSALKNWPDAYPAPGTSAGTVACSEVADLIRNPDLNSKDFVVVDTRKDDHEGVHVRGSVLRTAQTFYDELAEFYDEFKDTKRVIFYCWSSHGRGPRCANWYQDYLDRRGNGASKAYFMDGGATEWLLSYKDQADLMDFDAGR